MLKSLYRFFTGKRNSYAKIDQLRYLSQSALIEEKATPYVVRTTLFFISSIIIGLIIWSALTEVEEIAITQGEVIPSKYVQTIQHLEGGIISQINVIEGDLVDKGQTIFTLDGTASKRDLSAMQVKRRSLEYNAIRLKAFIAGQEPDFTKLAVKSVNDEELAAEQLKIFNSMKTARKEEKDIIMQQIAQKKSAFAGLEKKKATLKDQMELDQQEVDMQNKLYQQGHISKLKLIEVQKRFNLTKAEYQETENEAEEEKNLVAEYEDRLESLEANAIDNAYQQLNIVETDLSQINETVQKLEEQVDRLEIRSPLHGFVKVLNIKTIGGVIESGQILAEIVPLEGKLIAEIQIQPKDIGHVKTGQKVNVKVSSYDFSRYGTIEGTLEYISATTFVNDDNSRYYMGRVSVSQNYVGNDSKKNIILPGMTVQADIVTGAKSILAYLLKPIHNSVTTAFTER